MLSFDTNKPIGIAADHAGFELKEQLKNYLQQKQLSVQDFGTNGPASVDYPDYAHPLAEAVENHQVCFGILICGSANGVAITANKHQGVRAAICWQEDIAQLARQHNDANIICLPARYISENAAEKMVELFMNTAFEGGRHQNRVEKINCR
jgi:ribose 5-phosphate isomerase B